MAKISDKLISAFPIILLYFSSLPKTVDYTFLLKSHFINFVQIAFLLYIRINCNIIKYNLVHIFIETKQGQNVLERIQLKFRNYGILKLHSFE